MKLNRFLMAALLMTGVTFASCDKDDDDELNDTDRDFALRASISNSAEVDAATLAISKATNTAVKAFAQSMVMEHGMAQTDLKSLGANVGIAIKDTIDPAHVALKTQLMALSGRQFDSVYIYTQVADHQATEANFQNEQNNGQHRDVRKYADTYLPHITMHRQRADSIATAYFRR